MTEREECPVHDLRGQPSLLRIMGYEVALSRWERVCVWYRDWRSPTMYVSPRAMFVFAALSLAACAAFLWGGYQLGLGACVP